MSDGVKNAIIKSTTLGNEDHACMTFLVTLDYGGGVQSFGSYFIDHPAINKDFHKERRPSILMGAAVKGIMQAVGVSRWEDLPNTHVRVIVEDGLVKGIGHILRDRWFRYDALWVQLEKWVHDEQEELPNIEYTQRSPFAVVVEK